MDRSKEKFNHDPLFKELQEISIRIGRLIKSVWIDLKLLVEV